MTGPSIVQRRSLIHRGRRLGAWLSVLGATTSEAVCTFQDKAIILRRGADS